MNYKLTLSDKFHDIKPSNAYQRGQNFIEYCYENVRNLRMTGARKIKHYEGNIREYDYEFEADSEKSIK